MIVTDTLAKMRAERLIRVRRMANLSRKETCENSDININTLKGWELARHGGLTKTGAVKIVQRLKQSGVLCHPQWLLDGTGSPPIIQYEQSPGQQLHCDVDLTFNERKDEEIAKMRLELALFEQHSQPVLYRFIMNEDLAPYYQKHDLVAGKITSQLDTCLGKYCLVQVDSQNILVGKLLSATDQLLVVDLLFDEHFPYLSKQYVGPCQQCAVICWHRKYGH